MTSLTPEQISSLTRKADQAESSHKSRWLTAHDAVHVLEAMEFRATQIAIGGEMFEIIYDSPHKVFLKPSKVGKYVPCGWYTDQLLRSIAVQG